MSIKWYRAGRVTTPRRDSPSGPKQLPRKRNKKLGKPRRPGVRKPHVQIPFVTAFCMPIRTAGRLMNNSSVGGLNAVSMIAADSGFHIDEIVWKHSASSRPCRDLVKANEEEPGDVTPVCKYLSEISPWGSMDEFSATAVRQFPNSGRTDGIWALSHVNCECSLRIRMANEAGLVAYYLVFVRDVNSFGYSFDPLGSTTRDASGAIVPPADISDDTKQEIAKMNVEQDPEKREELCMFYDLFGNAVRSETVPGAVSKNPGEGPVDIETAIRDLNEMRQSPQEVEEAPEPTAEQYMAEQETAEEKAEREKLSNPHAPGA